MHLYGRRIPETCNRDLSWKCPAYGKDGHNDHNNDPKGIEIVYEGGIHDLHHTSVVKVGCFKDRTARKGRKFTVLYRHEDDDCNITFSTDLPDGECSSWMELFESSRDTLWSDIEWQKMRKLVFRCRGKSAGEWAVIMDRKSSLPSNLSDLAVEDDVETVVAVMDKSTFGEKVLNYIDRKKETFGETARRFDSVWPSNVISRSLFTTTANGEKMLHTGPILPRPVYGAFIHQRLDALLAHILPIEKDNLMVRGFLSYLGRLGDDPLHPPKRPEYMLIFHSHRGGIGKSCFFTFIANALGCIPIPSLDNLMKTFGDSFGRHLLEGQSVVVVDQSDQVKNRKIKLTTLKPYITGVEDGRQKQRLQACRAAVLVYRPY